VKEARVQGNKEVESEEKKERTIKPHFLKSQEAGAVSPFHLKFKTSVNEFKAK